MTERKGDWIQTYTGAQFWPLDPRPGEMHLADVAAGLARDCRFGGHCLKFLSVAEHSVMMARYAAFSGCSIRVCRAALFHEVSEGLGLRDMVAPVKKYLPEYKAIEARIMAVAADRFDFDYPLPKEIKTLDARMLLTEQAANMAPAPAPWHTPDNIGAVAPLPVMLEFWSPDQAMSNFLAAAAHLGAR